MSESKLEMWMSPLTNRIFIGKSRANKIGRVAESKQDVTTQCINGAVAYLVATNDLDIIVTLDEGKRYRVRITPETQ